MNRIFCTSFTPPYLDINCAFLFCPLGVENVNAERETFEILRGWKNIMRLFKRQFFSILLFICRICFQLSMVKWRLEHHKGR